MSGAERYLPRISRPLRDFSAACSQSKQRSSYTISGLLFPSRARERLLRARTSHVSARDRFFINDPALPGDVMVNHERVVPEFLERLGSLDNDINRHTDPVQVTIEFHGEFTAVLYSPFDDADIVVAFLCLRPF